MPMDERCDSCEVLMEWDDMPLKECDAKWCTRRICTSCSMRNTKVCRQCMQAGLRALYG